MFLTSVSQVLAGVSRIAGLTAPPATFGDLMKTAQTGALALQLDPPAWTIFRAIRDGWGDPERNLRLLQARAEAAAAGFNLLFSHKESFTIPDLVEAYLERGSRALFPIRERVAVTGDRSIPPEELLIPIGGLFVFDGGTVGLARWDTRLVDRMPTFPLALPTDIGPLGSDGAFGAGQELAPQTWEETRDFAARRGRDPSGKVVLSDSPTPRLRVKTYAAEGASEIAVGTVTYYRYPGIVETPSRAQRGISVSTSGDVPFIHTWEVEEPPGVGSATLDSDLTQVIFTPGALLLVRTGRPAEIPHLPLRPLAAMVRGASRAIEGDRSAFQREAELMIDRSSKEGDIRVRIEDEEVLFGGKHESWLTQEWIYRQGDLEVRALRVGNNPQNHSSAERLVRETLTLAKGVRSALRRPKESPSDKVH